MKNLAKIDYINIAIIVVVFLLLVIALTSSGFIFGSVIDWGSQHWTIPEYFRTLFYDTKNIFPSFAFNMGGGQNIYYFSYYGLLSPVIMLSYLLPFISMPYYIIGMMVILGISSIILMYRFLYNRFNSIVCFTSTMLFILANPIIFHSHRHIMFVDYIPFLIMGLMGVDRYFDNNKKALLIISIFLIIMTSYFYSVGSIISILLYGIYKYIEKNKKIELRRLVLDGFNFIKYIFISILMASVILLPTAYVLINGRTDTTVTTNILEFITPSFNIEFICGTAYSMGLSVFALIALIENMLQKKKSNLYLVIVFLLVIVFPVFTYLLNGTMYIDSKALIPFIPLMIILMSNTLSRILNFKYDFNKVLISSLILLTITIVSGFNYMLIMGLAIIILLLTIHHFFKKKSLLIIPLLGFSLITCYIENKEDTLMSSSTLNDQLNNKQSIIVASISEKDKKMYRFGNQIHKSQNINRVYNPNYYEATVYSSTSNHYYNNFYFNMIGNENTHRNTAITTAPNNIMFNTYMGIKYTMTSMPMAGYKLYNKVNGIKTYVNDDVLPIAYVSDRLMSESDFNKLKYPYNIEALLSRTIINGNVKSEFNSNIEKVDLIYTKEFSDLIIKKTNDIYYIDASKNNNLILKLEQPLENKVLFVRFKMLLSQDCIQNVSGGGDMHIDINGVRNKLTCKQWKYHNGNYDFEYAISSTDAINELKITFKPGQYQIANISTYVIDYNYVRSLKSNVDEFLIDKKLTKGDKIVGDITVTEDGYFNTSIPYDKGFTVMVDNKKVAHEIIDKSFLGFKIEKGYHRVEITYRSPYLQFGKIMSLIGFMLFLSVIYVERRKR